MMNFYYIGLERYKMLGQMLATHLGMEMHPIIDNWDDVHKIKEDDIVYCHFFQPDFLDGKCKMICPKLDIAMKWDSKIYQYEQLDGIVPLPKFYVCEDYVSMARAVKNEEIVFITLPHGNTGHTSIIYKDGDKLSDTASKLGIIVDGHTQIRVSEYIDKDYCISVHNIIASETDMYISQPVRQIIGKDGVTFRGGRYPIINEMTMKQVSQVFGYTRDIGRILARDGYRGMVGVDYMIKDDDVIFCEINPRKMGTTVPLSMVMEFENQITIPALEYEAIVNGKLPDVVQYKSHKMGWYVTMYDQPPEYKDKPGDERKVFYTPGKVNFFDDYYYEFGTYELS
jgi:predicted ATP-grasp superfamily ATP-dependent carboligase